MTDEAERWKVPVAELPQRKDFLNGHPRGWTAWNNARRSVCRHAFTEKRWAGILGWRYDCGQCGEMFVPHRHEGCTECRFHPDLADDA